MGEISGHNLHLSTLFKKLCLIFLVWTIVNISLTKSIIMFQAVYLYNSTGVPWYETWNYIFLGLAVLILPNLSLFFLDSEHIRKLLRFYLLIILFFNIMELSEGIFSNISEIWNFERKLNVIYILIESISATVCWLFLLRQFGGKSLLPIPINTEMHTGYTATEFWIMNAYRNLKSFLINPVASNKKLVNVVIVVNFCIISGLLITMIPDNAPIIINRPTDHSMRLSFWGGNNLDNSTLDLIGQQNGRLFVWGNALDESKWSRFKDRNVDVLVVNGFETDESKWDQDFQEIATYMDILDSQANTGIVGFVDDMEQLTRIIKYNSTYYEKYVNYIQNKTNYVRSRGYEYHLTQWLTAINDDRDNDADMGVVLKNPFDPVKFENLSSIGWMIYRSELAIKYDEPYEYFSHHWATQVRNYMTYLEDKYNYPRGFWMNKTTVSIGVMGTSSPFIFNGDMNEDAKANMMKEIKIWHANQISEVIIFIAGETNTAGEGTKEFFEYIGGNTGLSEIYTDLDTYDQIKLNFKRRATFLGNLKMLSNMPGSVFGLFYADILYGVNSAYLLLLTGGIYLGCGIGVFRRNYSQKRIVPEREPFSPLSFLFRSLFFLEIIGFTIAVYFTFRWPEIFIILGKIDYFLSIFY